MINKILTSSYYLLSYRWITRIVGFLVILFVARIIDPEEFGKFAVIISFMAISESLITLPYDNAIIQSSRLGKKDINSIWTYTRFLKSLIFFVLFNLFILFFNFSFLVQDKNLYYIASLSILGNGIYNTYINRDIRNVDYKSDMISSFIGRMLRLLILLILCWYLKNAYALIISWVIEAYSKSISSFFVTKQRVTFELSFKPIKKHFKYSFTSYIDNMLDQLVINLENLFALSFLGAKFSGLLQATKRINSEFTADFKLLLDKILFPFYSRMQNNKEKIMKTLNNYLPLVIYLVSIVCIIGYILIEDLIKLFLGPKWLDVVLLCKIFFIFGFIRIMNNQMKTIFRSLNVQRFNIYSSMGYVVSISILLILFRKFELLNSIFFVSSLVSSVFVTFVINFYFFKKNVNFQVKDFFKKNFIVFFSIIIILIISLLTNEYIINYLESYFLVFLVKLILIFFILFISYILYSFNFSKFETNIDFMLRQIMKRKA